MPLTEAAESFFAGWCRHQSWLHRTLPCMESPNQMLPDLAPKRMLYVYNPNLVCYNILISSGVRISPRWGEIHVMFEHWLVGRSVTVAQYFFAGGI